MPSNLLDIRFDKGMLPDLIPYEIPDGYAQEIRGAVCTERGLAPIGAPTLRYTLSALGYILNGIKVKAYNGVEYLFVGTTSSLYRINIVTGDQVDVSKAGGYDSRATWWSFAQYGDKLIATNWHDPVQVIDIGTGATGDFADLAGSPPKAKHVFFDSGHLILGNTLGADLVTNGSFTGSAAGWTLGAAWHYNANAVDKDTDGVETLEQATTVGVVGSTFRVKYNCTALSVGSVIPTFGGVALTAIAATGKGQGLVTCLTTGPLIFTPVGATSRFTLDDLIVEQVYPKKVQWSGWENIETWAASLSTGAGSQTLADAAGEIMGFGQLSQGFGVILDKSVLAAQYTRQITFSFRTPFYNAGAYASGSIVSDGDFVFFFDMGNFMAFNGQSKPISISDGVFRTLQNEMLYASLNPVGVFSCIDMQHQIIYWWFIASATPYFNIIAFNFKTSSWSYAFKYWGNGTTPAGVTLVALNGVVPFIYGLYENVLCVVQAETGNNRLYECEKLPNYDITPNTIRIKTKEIGNGDDILTVSGIKPMRHRGSGVEATLNFRMNEADAETSLTAVSADADGWCNFLRAAKFHSFTILFTPSTQPNSTCNSARVKVVGTGKK